MSSDPAVKTGTDSSAIKLPSLQPDTRLAQGGATTLSKDVENLGEDGAQAIGVQWENRAPMTRAQTMWLVLYMIAVGIFFADGLICVFKKNIALVNHSEVCPGEWLRRNDEFDLSSRSASNWWVSRFCLSPELNTQWESCLTDVGSKMSAPLKGEETKTWQREEERENDMWDVLGRNLQVVLVVFPAMVLCSVAWFFALKNFPFQVVYGTIGTGCIGLLVVSALLKDAGTEAMVTPILMSLGIAIATYFCRDSIAFTCRTISAACTILKNQPHVFGACFILKLCWIAVLGFLVWFRFSADHYAVVEQEPLQQWGKDALDQWRELVSTDTMICSLIHKKATNLGGIEIFCFIWIITWFEMAAVLVCSVAMGGYYFHRDDALAPATPGLTALQWAFSGSAGCVAESSVTVTLNYYARRFGSLNMWTIGCICNPFWCIFFVIYKLLQTTIDMLSRFSVIMHGFHGGGMFTEGTRRPPFSSLVKHLGTTLVNATVGQGVLIAAAGLLSTLMALGTWLWLDAVYGFGMARALGTLGFAGFAFPLYVYILLAYAHKWVLFSLLLVSMARGQLGFLTDTRVAIVLASLFVGCVCMMVLQFFVDIVFYSTDGLIYCYVIAAETGEDFSTGELAEFHELIQSVKEKNAESEPFAGELQPDDKPPKEQADADAPKADSDEDAEANF